MEIAPLMFKVRSPVTRSIVYLVDDHVFGRGG
jgi:hypothetical protein